MSTKNFKIPLNSDEGLISTLVYSALNISKEHLRRPAHPGWIEEAGKLLVQHCLSKTFEQKTILQELLDMGFKVDTIVDHCIPIAATRLGEAWVKDTLSFSEATIGSANLQRLLNHIAQDRENNFISDSGKRFLICVHESEQHTLGALVLGDMLRRQGHSLKIKLDAQLTQICDLQESNDYDGIFFSCSSFLSIKETAACVRKIRETLSNTCPIFLGGTDIGKISQGLDLNEFDLVTNSLKSVTEYLEKSKKEVALNLSMAAEG